MSLKSVTIYAVWMFLPMRLDEVVLRSLRGLILTELRNVVTRAQHRPLVSPDNIPTLRRKNS